ncbi:VC0807 family protein [Nonomuraea sp. SBT364]|uniref:VC0807 family protein n=1 Tax=Nonomuraea sp. SBT364 TaxID=1580530 RepID=UPI0007C7F86F|nr:VC0807 family protein [Nonomuraea sp. SBT364]
MTVTTRPEARTASWQVLLAIMLVVFVAVPVAAFYGLRALGASPWLALLAGAVVPAAALAHKVIAGGRIDGLDRFTIATLALTGVGSLLSGDPRLLLFRDALTGAVAGGWALVTAVSSRPLALELTLQLGAPEREAAWRTSPAYRSGIRTITALWGAGLLLDAAVSAVVTSMVPPDLVPLVRLSGLVFVAAAVTAGVVHARRFRRRHGHRLVIPDNGRIVLDYQT